MNCSIVIDWKSIGVFSLGVIGTILAVRIDPDTAKEAFCKLLDACKEGACAIAASANL